MSNIKIGTYLGITNSDEYPVTFVSASSANSIYDIYLEKILYDYDSGEQIESDYSVIGIGCIECSGGLLQYLNAGVNGYSSIVDTNRPRIRIYSLDSSSLSSLINSYNGSVVISITVYYIAKDDE